MIVVLNKWRAKHNMTGDKLDAEVTWEGHSIENQFFTQYLIFFTNVLILVTMLIRYEDYTLCKKVITFL